VKAVVFLIFQLIVKLCSMRTKNLLLALGLSIVLTVVLEAAYIVYALYPLIAAWLDIGQPAGIGAIGGLLLVLPFMIGPFLFVAIFGALQWRSNRVKA
jgi:hypothetical protein